MKTESLACNRIKNFSVRKSGLKIVMKSVAALFLILLFTLRVACADVTSIPIQVLENGEPSREIDLALIDRMGYLRAREVAAVFNAEISYISDTGKIIYSWPHLGHEKEVLFKIGSDYVVMEGVHRRMMKTPLIISDTAYIPLEAIITRAFQNVIEGVVSWNFDDRTLWVSMKDGIREVRNYSYNNYSRFVIETGGKLDFTTIRRRNSWEIIFEDSPLVFPYGGEYVGDGVIERISVEKTDRGAVFTVHTGKKAGEVQVKKYPAPPRVVVDIVNTDPAPPDKKHEDVIRAIRTDIAMRDRESGEDIELVIIDPGHGGRDPGAIGAMGTREKDVVLAIARMLASEIKRELNIRAELTRTGDYFVPLAQRTEIANNKGADIFISLHANSSLNPNARGLEVYFLSEDASDSEAAAVAARENSVVAMEERSPEMDRLTTILWSLTLNQFMNESSELASVVTRNVLRGTPLSNLGVKQAGFYVMKGARMPAVLVELGFLSNREDERLLNCGDFQLSAARAITAAVKEYRDMVNSR